MNDAFGRRTSGGDDVPSQRLGLIDLFAGCGGLTEGFHRAGFNPLYAVERDRHAAATYAANFSQHVDCLTIEETSAEDYPRAELLVGGPPCQGFSNLGRHDADDPRNRLWREYRRVVEIVRPRVFVIENVPQFLNSSQFRQLELEVKVGRIRGYEITYGLVNAADFGVPQRRIRAIVIGSRVGPASLPSPTHTGPDGWVTLQDALSGPSLSVVSRLGRSEGARRWGVSTTSAVGGVVGLVR